MKEALFTPEELKALALYDAMVDKSECTWEERREADERGKAILRARRLKSPPALSQGAQLEMLELREKTQRAKEYHQGWYEAHQEERLAYQQKYRAEHREEYLAKNRAYQRKKRAELEAYWASHPGAKEAYLAEQRAKTKARWEANPESYKRHLEKCRTQSAEARRRKKEDKV